MIGAGGNRRSISIFDLDRTLTRRPTYSLFLLAAAARDAPWRLLLVPAVVVAMALHLSGVLARKRLKEIMHALLLGRRANADRVARLAAAFADRLQADGFYEGGLARLRADREHGRLIVLATAAPDYYADAIATRLGFDAVLSTRCGRDDGAVLARIDGPNCHGPDKLRALQAWLAEQGLERGAVHIRFYSDDLSDRPAFEWADEPIAVNPHRALRALAARRGWAVMDWRRPVGPPRS